MNTPWYEKAKAVMKERKITYDDLAEELGVTPGAVGHWMSGRNKPRIETIQQIAGYLKMSVSELCGEDVYFIVDDDERHAIDLIRTLPQEDQIRALRILETFQTDPPDKSSDK